MTKQSLSKSDQENNTEKQNKTSKTSSTLSNPSSSEPLPGQKEEVKIKSGNLSLLRRKDKEKILFAMRKISEDLSSMELFFSQFDMTKEQMLRTNQFIKNNKQRITNAIWTFTGPSDLLLPGDLPDFLQKKKKKKKSK